MPSPTDYPTPGKIITVNDGSVVFTPRGTRYQLHLKTAGQYTGQVNGLVEALIRVQARKLWTVPSGGNFISPIIGPPRTIQGRVRYIDDRQMVLQAGANFIVELPADDAALDLNNGAIALNTMVNIVALPGVSMTIVGEGVSPASGASVVGASAGQ
jgi:hypothetical protein